MVIAELGAWVALAAIISVCWDLYSHDDRQKKWEDKHPNQRYIRNYRKLTGTK